MDHPDLGLAGGGSAQVVAVDLEGDVVQRADGGHGVGLAGRDLGDGLDHQVGGGSGPGRADRQVVGPGGQLQVVRDGLVLDPGQHLVVVDVDVDHRRVGGEVGDPHSGRVGLGAGGHGQGEQAGGAQGQD